MCLCVETSFFCVAFLNSGSKILEFEECWGRLPDSWCCDILTLGSRGTDVVSMVRRETAEGTDVIFIGLIYQRNTTKNNSSQWCKAICLQTEGVARNDDQNPSAAAAPVTQRKSYSVRTCGRIKLLQQGYQGSSH